MCKFICRLFKKKQSKIPTPTPPTSPTPPTPPTSPSPAPPENVKTDIALLNNNATPIDVSIYFDGITIIPTQTCAGHSVTKLIPNLEGITLHGNPKLIELTYLNGYIPTTADLTFGLKNHAPDSYGNPITWNSIDITGVTDFQLIIS